MNLPGVEFLVDDRGRKKAVLIDLNKQRGLWEDLYDAYLAHRRRDEPREPLTAIKRRLQRKSKHKARG
jgi:hypothetical protein